MALNNPPSPPDKIPGSQQTIEFLNLNRSVTLKKGETKLSINCDFLLDPQKRKTVEKLLNDLDLNQPGQFKIMATACQLKPKEKDKNVLER